MHMLSNDEDLLRILTEAETIAVLGAHPDPNRAAHYVPLYLQQVGYRVLPVNPQLAGQQLFGETVYGKLSEITERVDIVNVFRRSDHLRGHLDDILAMVPQPGCVWLQLGIRNADFARRLAEEGIAVVQDRCTMVDHRRLIGAGGG